MPYFNASEERPRRAKRFLTAREVEDMVATGCTEIIHLEDMVITDAAREVAHDLGLRIRAPQNASSPANPPAQVLPSAAPAPNALTVPRQAPALAGAPALVAAHRVGCDDPLVRALVQAARARLVGQPR